MAGFGTVKVSKERIVSYCVMRTASGTGLGLQKEPLSDYHQNVPYFLPETPPLRIC
jgi:hypothetical protein